MEFDQVLKQLEWLNDERRKDKDIISKQEERLTAMEGRISAANQQIKDLDSEIVRLTTVVNRMDEFDSTLEEFFAKKFGSERNGWQLIREGRILHSHQKTFVPDFTFRHKNGTEVLLEIVGFWTPEYLAHRRETLQQFPHHRIIIAVPEKSLREGVNVGKNVLVYKTALKLTPLMRILERIRAEDRNC